MKNIEQPNEQLDYDFLKKGLLSGDISAKEVHLKLLAADQKSGTHEAAHTNLFFLEDVDVQNYIRTQPENIQYTYMRFLGFTQWHIAQNCMFEGKEAEGLELFKQSVQNSIAGNADESWIAYGEGTIAYLQKDVEGLKAAIAKEKASDKNRAILERMLARIDKGEEPDYKLDY